MSTNVMISLEKRRTGKDGTHSLVLRVGHNRRTASIGLNIRVSEKDWDSKNRRIKNTYKGVGSVTRLNNMLEKRKADALDIIVKLQDAKKLNMLSVAELKDRIVTKDTQSSFFTFAHAHIEELKKAGRFGTARSYKEVLGVLNTYTAEKDLAFEDVDYNFLTQFETYHIAKGNAYNGLAVYMRTIRALYNKGIKAGLASKEHYPFSDYTIKTIPTEKRALTWEHIQKILSLDLAPGHECFDVRNYFVASYLMYGMNFTDMAYLTKRNIRNGRIHYRRRKTSKLYDIRISDNLQTILSYYINMHSDSDFIFPIIKRDIPAMQYRDIQWARKRYNKKLKELATLCGIEDNLTSYVSRHSFATQAMLQEVPINAISTMLGHSDLKTTQVYLKSLPANILDEYNKRITG